jgi:signal transduction histidine kinase
VESAIEPGIKIEADAGLLQRVIHNLFSNAVKYNRDGGEVKCVLSKVGDSIELTMANTGEPIPRVEREKIFDRFYRSREGSNSRVEGVGLGLSLAREIVTAHGGEISVSDDAGEGMTVFKVRLKQPALM